MNQRASGRPFGAWPVRADGSGTCDSDFIDVSNCTHETHTMNLTALPFPVRRRLPTPMPPEVDPDPAPPPDDDPDPGPDSPPIPEREPDDERDDERDDSRDQDRQHAPRSAVYVRGKHDEASASRSVRVALRESAHYQSGLFTSWR